MIFNVITIFPDFFTDIFEHGILKKALDSGKIEINILDLRHFADNKRNQVDDRPYGGGAGMVLMPEPLSNCIELLKKNYPNQKVIYLTPSGKTFKQEQAEEFSDDTVLTFICGRYEGIDQRIIDLYVDQEISIGDYVLSGGELPCAVVIDAVARLIPGVILNEEFNNSESFSNPEDRQQLDFPVYTRPEEFKGIKVPSVLLSGNHSHIDHWRSENKRRKNE